MLRNRGSRVCPLKEVGWPQCPPAMRPRVAVQSAISRIHSRKHNKKRPDRDAVPIRGTAPIRALLLFLSTLYGVSIDWAFTSQLMAWVLHPLEVTTLPSGLAQRASTPSSRSTRACPSARLMQNKPVERPSARPESLHSTVTESK